MAGRVFQRYAKSVGLHYKQPFLQDTIRLQSTVAAPQESPNTFKFSELEVTLAPPNVLKPKPDVSELIFGKVFSDHMMEVEYTSKRGWGRPAIKPMHNLHLHPGAKVLHYATELFEGMKAFRGADGKIRLFRPDKNIDRLLRTAARATLPTFDGWEFVECLKKLVRIEEEWIPHSKSSSLYIRPTFVATEASLGVATSHSALLYVILCPVGPYFASGYKPVSLLADPKNVRAWPGGCGDMKMGSNYAPTIAIQKDAERQGLQQVLWLFGDDHQLTEVGTMNIFVFLKNRNGERELVTPPLNGLILPGVTRLSLLELARKWGEFKVTERPINMKEVLEAHKEKRILEMFGSGTACIVCPVSDIHYMGQVINVPSDMNSKDSLTNRFLVTLQNIQYGVTPHEWAIDVD